MLLSYWTRKVNDNGTVTYTAKKGGLTAQIVLNRKEIAMSHHKHGVPQSPKKVRFYRKGGKGFTIQESSPYKAFRKAQFLLYSMPQNPVGTRHSHKRRLDPTRTSNKTLKARRN